MPGKKTLLLASALYLTAISSASYAKTREIVMEKEQVASTSPIRIAKGRRKGWVLERATVLHAAGMEGREIAKRTEEKQDIVKIPAIEQPDIRVRQKTIVRDALKRMEQECVDALKNFYVVYNDLPTRGQAGKSTIILSGKVDAAETEESANEFRGLLLHEFGHVTSLSDCLGERQRQGESPFHDGAEAIPTKRKATEFYEISWLNDVTKRAGATEADFVTGYAATEPIEEFAETFAYFLLQPEAFRERAERSEILARKLLWMEQNVFRNVHTVAEGLSAPTGDVPWDATKLPYRWKAEDALLSQEG